MGKKSWERLCEEREFNAFYQALAQQSGFEQIGRFLQHGSTTRLMHSVAVAYYSYRLAKITRLSFHWEEMVRGALLHDCTCKMKVDTHKSVGVCFFMVR